MRRSTIAYVAAALAVPAAIAGVGPHMGMLRGSLGAEVEFAADGDLLRHAIYDASALAGEPATLVIDGLKHSDGFDTSAGGKVELAYGIDSNIEVYGAVGYMKTNASGFDAGTVTLDNSGTTLPVFGTFGDYDTWSIEAGARYYTGYEDDMVRPFLGANIGARFADSVDVDLQVNGASVAGIDNFYNSSTMFTAGLEAGIAFGNGDNLEGSFSVGAKYVSGYDVNEDALNAQGVASVAADSDRIVIPVKGSVSVKF